MAQYQSHSVISGETLGLIAKSYGVTVGDLIALNNIQNPDLISIGQILNIRRVTQSTYTVTNGDSLWALSGHYGVTVAAIMEANDLDDPDLITVGQKLKIPPGVGEASLPEPKPALVSGSDTLPGKLAIKASQIAQQSVLKKSIGYCYRYVKKALLKAGAVNRYLEGDRAIAAGPILASEGFVDILPLKLSAIKSPYDAPEGAILIYKASRDAIDKNRIYGHIEFRTSDGFASDYYSPNARTGARSNGLTKYGRSGRSLVGVWVKPDHVPVAMPTAEDMPDLEENPFGSGNLELASVNGKYSADILDAAAKMKVAPQMLATTIEAEARKRTDVRGQWDASSKAPTSSATGLMQFLNATWKDEAKRPGSWLNVEAKSRGIIDESNNIIDQKILLGFRLDARASIFAGAELLKNNLARLKTNNAIPAGTTPAGLAKIGYLAHHEGTTGALRFLTGDMNRVTRDKFKAQVPNGSRRQGYLDATEGNIGLAYRNWMSEYIDKKIDITKFMKDKSGITVPTLISLCR